MNINYPIFSRTLFSNIIAVNSPRTWSLVIMWRHKWCGGFTSHCIWAWHWVDSFVVTILFTTSFFFDNVTKKTECTSIVGSRLIANGRNWLHISSRLYIRLCGQLHIRNRLYTQLLRVAIGPLADRLFDQSTRTSTTIGSSGPCHWLSQQKLIAHT